MFGKNRLLVTNELVEFEMACSFMNAFSPFSRLKLETSGELPVVLEESIEYTSNEYSKTGRCQHVTGWI